MISTSQEAALASHESAESGIDIEDAVHRHFAELSPTFDDWCDVAKEGRRLWEIMFRETLPEWSPQDSLISGVAAAAYALAIESVAKKLNVSAFAVACGLESQEEPGVAGFLAECERYNKPEENPRS